MRDILVFAGYTFLVLALIFLVLIVMERAYRKKAAAPRPPVRATLVARRTEAAAVLPSQGDSRITYYAAFLLENGDRRELRVTAEQFSLWQEGESGILEESDGAVTSFQVDNTKEA